MNQDWQSLLVYVIVGAALVWFVRWVYRQSRKGGCAPGCGCAGRSGSLRAKQREKPGDRPRK